MEIDILECEINFSHDLRYDFEIDAVYVGKDDIVGYEGIDYIKFNVSLNDKAIVIRPHVLPLGDALQSDIERQFIVKQRLRITGDRICIIPNEVCEDFEKLLVKGKKV